MRSSFIASAALALLASIVACNGGETPEGQTRGPSRMIEGDDVTQVIATIGDWEITQGYFDSRYERLTPSERTRYSGENWKSRFLDYLVEETLLYKAARDGNYDRLADVSREIDYQVRSVLVTSYHNKKFKEEIQPPEDAIEAYYQENLDAFRTSARALGRHIQCASEDRINEAWAALESGTPWARAAQEFSEDANTRDNGGLLGWFNPDGYVLGMGFNKEFTDVAFTLPANKVNPPVKVNDLWHIIRIDGRTEDTVNPLAEVHDRIVSTLRPIYGKEAYTEHLASLRETYQVKRFGEYIQGDVRTPEQLYRLAGESQNAHAKIDYYRSLVDRYPDHERAASSLFMVGFLYSEEFGDVPGAATAFRQLIRDYPDSDHVDEAEWMLQNLGRQEPRLMSAGSPKSADEAAARIGDLQN